MDETPVYFDMAGGVTHSIRGSKDVLQNSTGHDKTRFTVVLAISATGAKLPLMLRLKNLKKVPALPACKSCPSCRLLI